MSDYDSVRVIENAWIALSDGCRLAARVWLPADAGPGAEVPAVLEYLPYRKDDDTAWQDSTRHPYFASHGYASVRVDIRGTGDSDGILLDEYLRSEQDDALEVLAWIAAQPWCTGKVGMIGYSWGGFNGLQVAARRPPELAAVISLYSTDDRYTDDCHHMGGCVLGSDLLKWATWMLAYTALPPDPRFVGDRWHAIWLERIERTPPFIEAWLSHQRYDAYWKQGSIAEDYAAVMCPVLAVGGWADAYTNAVPRMLEHLTCPRKGIIGPWGHIFPERGVPGPAIGFLQECVRWWDRWLKGIENGVDREPLLRAWMQEPAVPERFYDTRPGRWIAEEHWPPAHVRVLEWPLGRGEGTVVVATVQTCGSTAGVWCANGRAEELPADQAPDDALSVTFDFGPLDERMEILGRPEVELVLTADRPVAHVTARLCDVAPDGASTLIAWEPLNLTHRDGHEEPRPLEPGSEYTVRIRLGVTGQAVEGGHRLRLALSSAYWPHAWPAPEAATLRLRPDASVLRLPVRSPDAPDGDVAFPEPEWAPPLELREVVAPARSRRVEHGEDARTVTTRDIERGSHVIVASGTEYGHTSVDEWHITADDPLSASVRCERDVVLRRDGWDVRVLAGARMRADERAFLVECDLTAFLAEEPVAHRQWSFEIPRDLV